MRPAPPARPGPRCATGAKWPRPYEIARARALLAKALRAIGDDESADLELRAARDEFARLGATPDEAAAERELQAAEERRTGPAQARKTFMFTDIVGSTNLAELLGDEAWERLLRWHDDTLRDLVARSRRRDRQLDRRRLLRGVRLGRARESSALARSSGRSPSIAETSGFAISVRIGLHTAEANRRGARLQRRRRASRGAGRLARGGGEILATAETLDEAGERRNVGHVARPRSRASSAPVGDRHGDLGLSPSLGEGLVGAAPLRYAPLRAARSPERGPRKG